MSKLKSKNADCGDPIVSLNTPREIARQSKLPLHKILQVVYIHNVRPSAFADEIPIFSDSVAKKIISLCKDVYL